MKNLKISAKLILAFGLVLAMLIVSMGVSILTMMQQTEKIDYYANKVVPTVNAMWTGRRAMVATERALYKATSTNDMAKTQQFVNDAQKELEAIKGVLDTINANYTGDPQNPIKYKELMDSTVATKEKVYELLLANRNEEGTKLIEEQYAPVFTEAGNLLTSMATEIQGRVDQYYKDAEVASRNALISLVFLAVASIVVSIIMCVLVIKSIKRPITEIQNAATQLANGDLSANITYTGKDELGMLANDMRKLVDTIVGIIQDVDMGLAGIANGDFTVESKAEHLYVGDFAKLRNSIYTLITRLSDTLAQINLASDQVSSGSYQVSSGAQSLSQGATEQASSIEELAATITEISEQIKQNTSSAIEASSKSNTVGEEAQESNTRMNAMLQAMDEISNSSSEIGKIIKTIEDIAFQTNILALNAAVEAARAGAAGKGFAVVADEVRNLASKSAEASKNTATLIEDSLKAVQNGTKIADETAKSLNQVVSGVSEVSIIIDRISEASKEQTNAIAQVTTGVDQISAVVQTNSATAEESAAASEELSSQAQMLKELVGKFKLRGHSEAPQTVMAGIGERAGRASKAISIDLGMNTDKY